MKCILPFFWGNTISYGDYRGKEAVFRWPGKAGGLRFQMCILSGAKGTAMVWSEDTEVMQPKRIRWTCYGENPGIGFLTNAVEDAALVDPWGNGYRYQCSEPFLYSIWSAGQDALSGTVDDVDPSKVGY